MPWMAVPHGGSALFTLVRSRLRVSRLGSRRSPAWGCSSPPQSPSRPARTQPVSTPFSQWGDANSYFLIPGGTFEGTADQVGWTLSGASLSSGNEPFLVNGSDDSQSLTIAGGGSATSPFFCVDNTMTSLRFFAQQTASGGSLHVRALIQTPDGVQTVRLARLADGSMPAWAPTQPISGDTSGLSDDQSLMVALQFTVPRRERKLAGRRRVRRSRTARAEPRIADRAEGSVVERYEDEAESATERLLEHSWERASAASLGA